MSKKKYLYITRKEFEHLKSCVICTQSVCACQHCENHSNFKWDAERTEYFFDRLNELFAELKWGDKND